MANVIIALLILGMVFALAGFGVYTESASTLANARAARISAALERQVMSVQAIRNEDGVLPTNLRNVQAYEFTQVGSNEVEYSYLVVAGRGYVCARVVESNMLFVDALNRVVGTRPSWFLSGSCGNPNSPIFSHRFISVEV